MYGLWIVMVSFDDEVNRFTITKGWKGHGFNFHAWLLVDICPSLDGWTVWEIDEQGYAWVYNL